MTPLLWTLKQAAAELNVSASWLRGSDCPRYVIPTTGERSMIRFSPTETADWVTQFHQRVATRPELLRTG